MVEKVGVTGEKHRLWAKTYKLNLVRAKRSKRNPFLYGTYSDANSRCKCYM